MYNFLAISTTSSVILVLIFIFLSFFCVFLFIQNNKLKEKIKELELENKRLLEIKISKQKNIDSISINKISTSNNTKKKEPTKKIEQNLSTISIKKEQNKIQPKEINLNKPKKQEEKIPLTENKKLYQKNILHDKPRVTSPVSMTKIEDDFDLKDFIKKNELKVENNSKVEEQATKLLNSITKNDIKISSNKKGTNVEYLKEISNKMADELKPQTIELTDYEKMQEENAIISYKELLTLKDKLMMLDDEDETVNFIEELKKLRNSLK